MALEAFWVDALSGSDRPDSLVLVRRKVDGKLN